MRVRVFRREGNNQYYFQFLRDDGQVILNSEGYTTETARDNGVQSVINNAANADRYEILTNDGGGFYFLLKAANNQEIGRSVTFRNAESRNAAVALMQSEAANVEGGAANTDTADPKVEAEPYKASGDEDNYKPLNFYEARITGVDEGFDSFSEGDEHYFTYNLGGNVYLISEGYSSTGARDNGIQSVTNNMDKEDRYQRQQHPNGKYFFNLRAGNNKEIATSRWFDSQGEMDTIIARMIAGIGLGGRRLEEGTQLEAANRDANIAIAAPPAPREVDMPRKKRKKRSTPKKPKAEKEYVANGNYHFNNVTYDIFKSGNGRYYFTFKNAEGKTLFLNADVRGFETQEEAQAVVDQIMLYAPYEVNFDGKQARNGKYYFYIRGAEEKNIGKSFFYGTAEDMQSAVGLLLGNEAQMAALEESKGRAAANIDEYLECSAYAGDDGFYRFKHADNDEFYFAYNNDGKTYLRSEGYTTEKARDNGIESVIKNAPLDERWKTMKDEDDGLWYYSLRAGNHQEIARSCGYESEAAMNMAFGWIRGENSTIGKGAQLVDGVWYSGAWLLRKQQEEAAALAAKKAAEEAVARKATEEAAAKKAAEEEAARKAAAANIDEYLECSAYAGPDGFHKFKHADNGEFYFAYNHNGKTYLRSEGYTTEKARDNGIESVIKNAPLDERWKTMKDEDDGLWYYSLRAGNNQEIARSCGYESEAAMNTAWGWLRGEHSTIGKGARLVDGVWYSGAWLLRKQEEEAAAKKAAEEEAARKAAAAAAATAAAALAAKQAEAKKEENKDKEDDYLPCKEYEGHSVNDKINNVAFFRGKDDNQYYFVLYNEDGSVRLRSEGFPTAKERDQELSGVVRLKDEQEFYKRIEKGKYYMDILYDETGREVGRSCLRNSEEEAAAAAALLAAKKKEEEKKAAAAAALAAKKKEEEEAAAALLLAKKKEEKDRKAAAAAATAAAAASMAANKKTVTTTREKDTEGEGTLGWLPWLLIPLLLAALWFSRGCYGCDEAAIPPPMGVNSISVPPVQKVTPPAPPSCSCGTTECDAMNLPEDGRAQILTRLGTNPEFGNAHGLTGPQFLGRLRNRYATESADQKFLDELFTCMGYANGFADAKATMFSEVTIPNGKTGNMGYGSNHGTTYTTLNAKDPQDLEAFRVQAANGCDVHFMKTCGNHFFFCN